MNVERFFLSAYSNRFHFEMLIHDVFVDCFILLILLYREYNS